MFSARGTSADRGRGPTSNKLWLGKRSSRQSLDVKSPQKCCYIVACSDSETTRSCELDKHTPVYTKMLSKGVSLSKIANKQKRQELALKQKRAQEKLKREERFRRKKEEDKNPKLRIERRKRNIPATIERKRQWDSVDSENEDGLGLSVDVERIKRQKHDKELEEKGHDDGNSIEDQMEDARFDSDRDSMIDSGTDTDVDEAEKQKRNPRAEPTLTERATSPTRSTTSTNLGLIPEHLAERFSSLFEQTNRTPKILITTSINSNLHYEAELLTTFFPNAVYIPRSAHRYSHKYSVREISRFASNRGKLDNMHTEIDSYTG